MPARGERVNATITPEYLDFLRAYAEAHGMSSVSQALVELSRPAARAAGFDGKLMLGRGQYDRAAEELDAYVMSITNGGRNDPVAGDEDEERAESGM